METPSSRGSSSHELAFASSDAVLLVLVYEVVGR